MIASLVRRGKSQGDRTGSVQFHGENGSYIRRLLMPGDTISAAAARPLCRDPQTRKKYPTATDETRFLVASMTTQFCRSSPKKTSIVRPASIAVLSHTCFPVFSIHAAEQGQNSGSCYSGFAFSMRWFKSGECTGRSDGTSRTSSMSQILGFRFSSWRCSSTKTQGELIQHASRFEPRFPDDLSIAESRAMGTPWDSVGGYIAIPACARGLLSRTRNEN